MKTALTVLLLLAASMTAMAHNTANDNENEREWKLESVEMEPVSYTHLRAHET